MTIRISATLGVAFAALMAGCSDEAPRDAAAELEKAQKKVEQTLSDGARDVEAAADEIRGVVENMMNEDVQPSDQKALKELLPDEIGDLKRVAVSAEKRGAVGLTVSMANGEYETEDGGGRMAVSITDIGRMGSFASLGLTMAEVEIDREDRNGFERTTTYKGYRAMEKMAKMGDSSLAEMTVFVEDRVVLQIDAENIDFDTVRQAADAIDLDALAAML